MITIEAYRASIGCFFSKSRGGNKSRRNGSPPTRQTWFFSLPEFLQICITFLFILTLRCNINMAFLKLSLLLIAGDIESNPGPVTNKIQKVVLGSFHQGHSKFGDTAGIQCACIALYAICFSLVKKVSIWKSFDLDYILEKGNETFKLVGIPRALFMNELPHNISIENNNIDIEILANYFGYLGRDNLFEDHVTCYDTGNGLIFTTGGFSFSLIWSKNSNLRFFSQTRLPGVYCIIIYL